MGNHGKGCCKLNYDIKNHFKYALEKKKMACVVIARIKLNYIVW